MIIQSKINDTKDIMKKKAMEIDKIKLEKKLESSRNSISNGWRHGRGMGGGWEVGWEEAEWEEAEWEEARRRLPDPDIAGFGGVGMSQQRDAPEEVRGRWKGMKLGKKTPPGLLQAGHHPGAGVAQGRSRSPEGPSGPRFHRP